MARWVGLVRNVMLGRDGLDKALLLSLVADAGGQRPQSFLTTGNLTFTAARGDLEQVTERLELALGGVLGRPTAVVVRSLDWLTRELASEPFTGFTDDQWELEMCLLPLGSPRIDAHDLGDPGRTRLVRVGDRELLTARPRQGPSRPHGNRLLERASGRPATARGWSTLQRIVDCDRVAD